MLNAYTYLCVQGSFLAVFVGLCMLTGSKTGSTTCKAKPEPLVLLIRSSLHDEGSNKIIHGLSLASRGIKDIPLISLTHCLREGMIVHLTMIFLFVRV